MAIGGIRFLNPLRILSDNIKDLGTTCLSVFGLVVWRGCGDTNNDFYDFLSHCEIILLYDCA